MKTEKKTMNNISDFCIKGEQIRENLYDGKEKC